MKSFYSTDPPSHKGQTNSWLTPLNIVHSLGEFDLDPCGFKFHKTAKNIIQLPEDGLIEKWTGRIWLNPPYGKEQQKFLYKLSKHDGGGIALIFARLETNWIQDYLKNGFYQIQGRINFIKENGSSNKKGNAGCGSILIPFSEFDKKKILESGIKGKFFVCQ